MNRNQLINQIKSKRSFLCIGLDTDINKIPKHLLELDDPVYEFNKQIIDATKDLCVSYKPNTAFYESIGVNGWNSLEKSIHYIPENIFTIADAKRGDIGNTSNMYAKAFFDHLNFDSVTIAPYMGSDSVIPFLEFPQKWVILLALTSNVGSKDFQNIENKYSEKLFEQILSTSKKWGTDHNMMFVVGANRIDQLIAVRDIVPSHFLLIPGIGAQGGSLEEVVRYGMNSDCGLLVNSSRGIIYSGSGIDFAEKARFEAQKIQHEMDILLTKNGI